MKRIRNYMFMIFIALLLALVHLLNGLLLMLAQLMMLISRLFKFMAGEIAETVLWGSLAFMKLFTAFSAVREECKEWK